MKDETLDVIIENIRELFGILSHDSSLKFLQKLARINDSLPIGEIINNLNQTQAMDLVQFLMKAKFTEQPKPYFDNIISAIKAEYK